MISFTHLKLAFRYFGFAIMVPGVAGWAQSVPASAPLELDALTVLSPRIANQEPVATVAMPVSALRFEPMADLQARNFAEGQADIAIRGGTFANTGWTLAGIPLYDPQTGHYYAEVPLAPTMLSAPRIATGAALATGGAWNATAGGIAHTWRPVRPGGEVSLSVGDWNSRRADLTAGVDLGEGWSADFGTAWSRSDGPFANADHEFSRHSLRLAHAGERSVTNLAVGYQNKFFGWPNLYTPFNSPEAEDIQTLLVIGNHRQQVGTTGSYFEVGGYHRRNDDNYAYNRYAPVGPVPPFKHTTRVSAGGGRLHWAIGERSSVEGRLWVLADELESTSLRFGRFYTRTHLTSGVTFNHVLPLDDGRELQLLAGLGYDTSNRGADAMNPVVEVALAQPAALWQRFVAGYSTASQAPSYTAVAGNPRGGLFRGNPNLDRATSRTLDAKAEWALGGWTGSVGAFYRWDDELVDWTFRRGVFARSAAAVDLETAGIEAFAMRSGERLDLVLSYSWLHKDADYGSAAIDGSFYALNFPEHRLTAAVIWRVTDDFTLRLDNEVRWQQPNPLRLNGKDEDVLSSLGLYWRTPWDRRLQLSLQVDNVWDSAFEEIPAVPAAPRLIAAGVRWRW